MSPRDSRARLRSPTGQKKTRRSGSDNPWGLRLGSYAVFPEGSVRCRARLARSPVSISRRAALPTVRSRHGGCACARRPLRCRQSDRMSRAPQRRCSKPAHLARSSSGARSLRAASSFMDRFASHRIRSKARPVEATRRLPPVSLSEPIAISRTRFDDQSIATVAAASRLSQHSRAPGFAADRPKVSRAIDAETRALHERIGVKTSDQSRGYRCCPSSASKPEITSNSSSSMPL